MGCSSSSSAYIASDVMYLKEISNETTNSSPIFRNFATAANLEITPNEDGKSVTLQDIILAAFSKYSANYMFGSRSKHHGQKYEYQTYSEILQKVKIIGSAIINMNLIQPSDNNENFKIIGVYSKNREEWMILDLVASLYGFVLVPFYDTLGLDTIPYIINQTQMTTIFCGGESIKTFEKVDHNNIPTLQNIVCFDKEMVSADDTTILKKLYKFYYYEDDMLLKKPKQILDFPNNLTPEQIYVISYTSGTTGMPKGVQISHKNFVALYAGFQKSEIKDMLYPGDVYLSYLPLPHILEKILVFVFISSGNTVAFYGGNIKNIIEDLKDVKPHWFVSVPRLYNRIYDSMQNKIKYLRGLKAKLVKKAVATKLKNLKTTGTFTHKIYDKLVFNKMKEVFGGRVRLMVSGSAPISKDVVDFLKISAQCTFLEGYGSTEIMGCAFHQSPNDPTSGNVGGPFPSVEYKLENVKELNYFWHNNNDPQQIKNQGEICVRGNQVFAGYYKLPKETAEVLDSDGFFHTGDIGELLPNGALKIIDRKKNIFKLAQGEYIAPDKLESIFTLAEGVTEILVYGNSFKSFLVALVVPDEKYVNDAAKEMNLSNPYDELCKNVQINERILSNIAKIGNEKKICGFEYIKGIHLLPQPFAEINNGSLVTPSQKVKRKQAEIFFKEELEQIYSLIEGIKVLSPKRSPSKMNQINFFG